MFPSELAEQITLVLAVDPRGLEQLVHTLPTWQKYRPELFQMPWSVVVHGGAHGLMGACELLRAHGAGHAKVSYWKPRANYESQRERMLTAFVYTPPLAVHTRWWMKIDTDAYAVEHSQWLDHKWFEGDPVYIANHWGYTKAKGGGGGIDDWCESLESFGDQLTDEPRLDLAQHIDGRRMNMARMASWVSIYSTEWSTWLAEQCAEICGPWKLPVPSQDTTVWYAAARTRATTYTGRRWAKRLGWRNVSNQERLSRECAAVL